MINLNKGIRVLLLAIMLGEGVSTRVVAQSGQLLRKQMDFPVKEVETQPIGKQLEVSFTLVLDTVTLPANRFIRLVPALVKEDSISLLKPITVAGSRQYVLRKRKQTERILVKRKNGSNQTYSYSDRISYKAWMNGAKLVLNQDVCGCGGDHRAQYQTDVKTLKFYQPAYTVQPALAFVRPQVEMIKTRQESGQAFLDFPVNQTVIYPDYRQNYVELQKITHTIDRVKNDSNTIITHIHIHGYASPEGSFANNRRLAQGRAEALKQYVRQLYHFQDSIFSVASTPEDWEGLKAWVERNDLPQKAEISRIIASSLTEDDKNTALQRIEGGKVYTRLLKEVYPALRHSDYTVTYQVRAFQVEEAKKLLKTKPQLLSLEEMFAVAATYETGSEAFNELFELAVRMFPENETANLNAAWVAIGAKAYQRAAQYLKKAGKGPEAVHAQGVLYLMKGRYQEAEVCLKQAEKAGSKLASVNLKQLAAVRESSN